MSEFAEKVAIVTGGAHGIGRAVAKALAQRGTRVLLADLGTEVEGSGSHAEVASQVAEELSRDGAQVRGLCLDVAAPDAAKQLVDLAMQHFERVDFGVYCAGFHHERPLLRMTDDELTRVFDVHLLGAIRFSRELARTLTANKTPGSIVLCTSASAFFGSAGHGALAAAAGGLVGFVKTAATELRRHRVRINAVVPTARTRMTTDLPLFSTIRADSLTPEHVAEGISFLLTDAAEDVRGEVIGVAGGRIYAFRHAETSGAFLEDERIPTLEAIAAAWPAVLRR